VVNPVTSPGTAKTHPKKVLDVAALAAVLVVQLKSATSAQRLVTLPVTALRLVATVVVAVAVTVETKADTAVVLEVTVVVVVLETTADKPATPAVDTVTCLATALRAKSATTVARSVIFPETAPLRLQLSELATNASNLVTSKLNAQTRVRVCM